MSDCPHCGFTLHDNDTAVARLGRDLDEARATLKKIRTWANKEHKLRVKDDEMFYGGEASAKEHVRYLLDGGTEED
jgi:hypothetical protein